MSFRRKLAAVVLSAAAFVGLSGSPLARSQTLGPTRVSFGRLVQNSCNGDMIPIEGETQFHTTVVMDGSGGAHTIMRSISHGTGLGSPSDAFYHYFEDESSVIQFPATGFREMYIESKMRNISEGAEPNDYLIARTHITLSASGVIAGEVVDFRTACGPLP